MEEMPAETELNENGISIAHLMTLNKLSSVISNPTILLMIMSNDPKALKQREEGDFIIYTVSMPKNRGNSALKDSVYDELGEIYIHKSSASQYLKVKKGTDWVYVKNTPDSYPIIEKSAMTGGRRRRRRGTRRTKRRSHKNRK